MVLISRVKLFVFYDGYLAALPDYATFPNLNAVKFLDRRDNLAINPTIRLLSSRAIQNIPNMLGYL